MAQHNKKLAKQLKQEAITKLGYFGIDAKFMLRIKESQEDWIAQYRALSQFMNGGRGPIFWVNPELLDNPKEFVISVLHEYGHVIAEWAWVNKNPEINRLLSKNYPGTFGSRNWDEEEFAEGFAQFVAGNTKKKKQAINKILDLYRVGYQQPFEFTTNHFLSFAA